jgi:hypothetical protein
MLSTFLVSLTGFLWLDRTMDAWNIKNPYYFIHALHNAYIVWLTASDVATTFTDFYSLRMIPPNYEAAALVFALHIYHTILYYKTFRLDDWLHHGLMVGLSLPIGIFTPSSSFLGYSLFFATGLPGGIDYLLLFLQRNGFIERMTEKRVNRWLNVWVRSPGCVSHAALSAAYALSTATYHPFYHSLFLIPSALMLWNGQYFMNQIVTDVARREALEPARQV